MSDMHEADIEALALERLQAQGYAYCNGADMAPEGAPALRSSPGEVVLEPLLRAAVDRLNPSMPQSAREEAVRIVLRLSSPDLVTANEAFHDMLTRGVPVSYQKDGTERGDLVRLVDFERPEDNHFLAVNQFSVTESNVTKRPDIVLFVNGLPLVVVELKNAADENATIFTAWRQLQTYKQAIPSLLTYNALLVGHSVNSHINKESIRISLWRSPNAKKT